MVRPPEAAPADFDVVGLGAMNADRVYQVSNILLDDETVARDYHLAAGGSAANTIFALAKLGLRTAMIGAVGGDAEGRFLLDELEAVRCDISQVAVSVGRTTGHVVALTDDQGRRALYVWPGANMELRTTSRARNLLQRSQWLHLSAVVGEGAFATQLGLVGSLPPQVQLSLAPGAIYAARGAMTLSPLFERCGILFVNEDEARTLTSERNTREAAHRLLALGCRRVVVTFGPGVEASTFDDAILASAGLVVAYLTDGKEEITIPAVPTPFGGDSIGAGDAFAAGVLFGLLKGLSLTACGFLGRTIALRCLSGRGARAGLPTRAELDADLRRSS